MSQHWNSISKVSIKKLIANLFSIKQTEVDFPSRKFRLEYLRRLPTHGFRKQNFKNLFSIRKSCFYSIFKNWVEFNLVEKNPTVWYGPNPMRVRDKTVCFIIMIVWYFKSSMDFFQFEVAREDRSTICCKAQFQVQRWSLL